MPQRISPNRRRSIAVLGHSTASRTGNRRRAYSIVPGEKLSPAARARVLVPPKGILKGPKIRRVSHESVSASTSLGDDTMSNNFTQAMEFTEIHQGRKSVSFADTAFVRLFEVQKAKNRAVASDVIPDSDEDPDEHDEEEDEEDFDNNYFKDENIYTQEEDDPQRRRSRRRSSTAFTDVGERSMDMDMDDTAPIPQDFLNGPAIDDEIFEGVEDDYGEEDMDLTQAIPGAMGRRRQSSIGGLGGASGQRRNLLTASQSQSENQVPRRVATNNNPLETTPQRELYPSLEDLPDPSPSRGMFSPINEDENVTRTSAYSDMDLTTNSTSAGEQTTSSNADSTQPMEFTIPVIRPQPRPSQLWLDLRALTHAGEHEPYVPPEMEASDDPEANPIVRTDSGEGERDRTRARQSATGDAMDLTEAFNRIAKARPSLGLPAFEAQGQVELDLSGEGLDTTFSSNEESFTRDMSLDGNQTLNLTNLRMSLGGRTTAADTTMELTQTYGDEENIPPVVHETQRAASSEPVTSEPEPINKTSVFSTEKPPPATDLLKGPVFSAPQKTAPPAQPQPQPQPIQAPVPPPVFSLPTGPVFTAPSKQPEPVQSAKPPSTTQPPPSPSKAPAAATIPHPFTFSVPSRLSSRAGSPAKNPPSTAASTSSRKSPAPPSPSKVPVFRGTAAFAPPSASKSPGKRPAPPDEGDAEGPSPAKKQVVGKFTAGTDPVVSNVAKPTTATGPANTNRRQSAVRRPSGYFAQRKSLGGPGNALPSTNAPGSSLSKSTSAPSGLNTVRNAPSSPFRPTPARQASTSLITEPRTARRASVSPQPPPARVSPAPTLAPTAPQGPPIHVETPSSPAHGQQRSRSPHVEPQQQPSSSSQLAPPPTATNQRLSPRVSPRPITPEPQPSLSRDTGKAPARTIQFADEQDAGLGRDEQDEEEEQDMEQTGQWQDGMGETELLDEDEPTISIEQFFEMTNIRFMDEITAPRRSTVHPSQLRQRSRRRSLNSSHSEEAEQIPLAEFMTAMAIDVPQLELYSALSNDLTMWVEESKKICGQAEEDAVKVTPALFREFAAADELEKQDLLHQLKLIKAHNIASAKSQWYDWKSSWVDQLQESAESAFAELESDAKQLEVINAEVQEILPSLREEYAQIMAELKEEEEAVAEIESSDKNYLNDLKSSIAEQDLIIQGFRADLSEAQAKLARLTEKKDEIEAQKAELISAITQGQQLIQIQTSSTSSEAFRLKDELEALEDLHLWRAIRIAKDMKQFIYASRFQVSIPCVAHKPVPSEIRVERTKASKMKERDEFPELTELMIGCARHIAGMPQKDVDLRMVVQRLSDFWSSCAQIRLQLTFLAVQFPLELKLTPVENAMPTFEIKTKVLFPSTKSKGYITFIMDPDTYSRWPLSIGLLRSDVKVAYGRADRQQILTAVQSRLSQATSSENHGCLLDACIEATEQLAFA